MINLLALLFNEIEVVTYVSQQLNEMELETRKDLFQAKQLNQTLKLRRNTTQQVEEHEQTSPHPNKLELFQILQTKII